jgi:hypothetical protein
MTSHERFTATLNLKRPDRLMLDLLWPRQETLDLLGKHFNTGSKDVILEKLGVDFRWVALGESYPLFDEKVTGTLRGNAPGAGKKFIFHDPSTFEDEWGIVQKVGDDGRYLEWKDGPLAGKESLEGWSVPKVALPNLNAIRQTLAAYTDSITVLDVPFPFKIAWHICGYEHFLMQMALSPEFVCELYDHIYEFVTRKAVLGAEAGFDVVAVVGDLAGQDGLMFSTGMFEMFDLPRLTQLVNAIKAANPKTKVLYHSDGDMEAVIPQLIQCGVDIINPIQTACMDPVAIKEKYGDRITLHGTISVQDTIPNGSVEDVRNEVIHRIEKVGYNGGLVISTENSIPYDAPLENILAVYETVRSYDR